MYSIHLFCFYFSLKYSIFYEIRNCAEISSTRKILYSEGRMLVSWFRPHIILIMLTTTFYLQQSASCNLNDIEGNDIEGNDIDLVVETFSSEKTKTKRNEDISSNFRNFTSFLIRLQQESRRSKRSAKEKSEFSTSFTVFILELIMVLMSNLCTHMTRSYKNSVPQVKLNIIIIISHYIVKLGNLLLIFQVCMV